MSIQVVRMRVSYVHINRLRLQAVVKGNPVIKI